MNSTHERLLNEVIELRSRLRKTDEALALAAEALTNLGYTDVEVKRAKAINDENKAAEAAYWNSLGNEISKFAK